MSDNLSPGEIEALGFPMPSFITPEEAQSEARERSTDLISNWNTLRKILERHEEVLRKRWKKKTKQTRCNILLRAWPNMSTTHRPDMKALMKEGPNPRKSGAESREAYVWPYINLEDLSKGISLLILLNSRGRYPPHMFAHADFEATRLGRVSHEITPKFVDLHTMYLEGEEATTYGRLVAWNAENDALDDLMTRLQHHPGTGLLILEIQQRIIRFLVDCCQFILHDFTPSSLTTEGEIKPVPPSLIAASDGFLLASIAAEAPYRLPAQVDFKRLKSVVDARCASAEDHVHGLREDPGYFADVMKEWAEHRREKVLDIHGLPHPMLTKPLFWDRVLSSALKDAYYSLTVWHEISQQLDNLATLQEKYACIITPKTRLPVEYLKALLVFRYTLLKTRNGQILLLMGGAPSSPPLRSSSVRQPQEANTTINHLMRKPRQATSSLIFLLYCLWDEHKLFCLGLPTIMDEMETILQTDPSKLSSWVTRVFSDLGLIARLGHEVDIYQPWAAGFEHKMVDYIDELRKDHERRFPLLPKIHMTFLTISLSQLGAPTEGSFAYPSAKRRTQQNTEIMRQSEQKLDILWKSIDNHHEIRTGMTLVVSMEPLFAQVRTIERTATWVEPAAERDIHVLPNKDLQQPAQHFLHNPLSPSTKFTSAQKKLKPKTHALAEPITEPDPLVVEKQESIQPKFTLKKRAFNVFRTLFFNPAQSDLPGEVSWADFIFALSCTGFASEKLYGSVWQFNPTSVDVGRSIQFHEPHPTGKIPFCNARRIGRRLNRAYGWHGEMFELE